MEKEKKVKEIKKKVEALINEAIELLESNYDMDAVDTDNPAYMIMMDLNGALMDLYYLDEEGLKIKD